MIIDENTDTEIRKHFLIPKDGKGLIVIKMLHEACPSCSECGTFIMFGKKDELLGWLEYVKKNIERIS